MPQLALSPVFSPAPFLLLIDVGNGRVAVHGELDCEHVHRLVEVVGVLTRSPAACWSVDVSGVTFCDVAGIRGLIDVRRDAARAGHPLRITRSRPWLRHLLDVAEDLIARSEETTTSRHAPA